MKRMVARFLVVMVMVATASVMTRAEGKSEKVEFTRNIVVNGTMVKKGTYQILFDEKQQEIVIYQGKTVIARTPAKAENRNNRSTRTELTVINKDNNSVLRSIILAGDNHAIIVDEKADQAVAPQ